MWHSYGVRSCHVSSWGVHHRLYDRVSTSCQYILYYVTPIQPRPLAVLGIYVDWLVPRIALVKRTFQVKERRRNSKKKKRIFICQSKVSYIHGPVRYCHHRWLLREYEIVIRIKPLKIVYDDESNPDWLHSICSKGGYYFRENQKLSYCVEYYIGV